MSGHVAHAESNGRAYKHIVRKCKFVRTLFRIRRRFLFQKNKNRVQSNG